MRSIPADLAREALRREAEKRGLQPAASTRPSPFPYHPGQRHIFHEAGELGRFLVFPKGRRFGFTRGAAWATIDAMRAGKKILWGDTVNSNIRRYIERYFVPALRQHRLTYEWRKQDNALEVASGYTDFRSADNPENWEGFGYDLVILNEAGIILDDPYLWHNAVLPMLMDSPTARLIAGGTPKLSHNVGLLFRDLWDRAQAGEAGYYGRRFTTYDNPHLSRGMIEEIESAITPAEREQEIHARFVTLENLGSFFKREWFTFLPEAPKLARRVRGWDFAATEPSEATPDPDWTVGLGIGIAEDGTEGVYDCVMARTGPAGVDALLERTAAIDPSAEHAIPVDPGAAGKTAARHFREGPLAGKTVWEYPQTRQQGSKAARNTPVSIAASAGGMWIVQGEWNDWVFAQLAPFPNPKVHDDAPDAFGAGHNVITGTGRFEAFVL